MPKKKVLLVWWEIDQRPEFLEPFVMMGDDFDFVQVIYKNRDERTGTSSPFTMIYWHDYPNAQSLLRDIRPQVIIGVTESIFCAALIHAARKKDIPFYGLQHGYTPDNIAEVAADTRKFEKTLFSSYLKSTLFFLRSFSLFNPARFFSALYFYWLYPRMHVYKLLTKHHFPWLAPPYYICFSPYSAEHYKRMYRMQEDQIRYTGILWFDKLFKGFAACAGNRTSQANKYYLLIDTSFVNYQKPVSEAQINRCYQELASYCQANNARLVVKLHPLNYDSKTLPEVTHIEYVRKLSDESLHQLITGCEGCFGFHSTLILPILAIKPVIQIAYDGIYMKLPEKEGLTPVLDFYTFTQGDIRFPVKEMNDLHQQNLGYLLYSIDGHATERLKQILRNA